jgi:hypothetical protein
MSSVSLEQGFQNIFGPPEPNTALIFPLADPKIFKKKTYLRIWNGMGVRFSQQLHLHDLKNENKLIHMFLHAKHVSICP